MSWVTLTLHNGENIALNLDHSLPLSRCQKTMERAYERPSLISQGSRSFMWSKSRGAWSSALPNGSASYRLLSLCSFLGGGAFRYSLLRRVTPSTLGRDWNGERARGRPTACHHSGGGTSD